MQRTVQPGNIREPHGVPVGPAYYYGQFHKAGKHGSNGSTHYPHARGPKVAKNQDIVEGKVDQHRHNARFHRQQGFPSFSQRARVSLCNGIGQHPDVHHLDVLQAIAQGGFGIFHGALAFQVEIDELGAEGGKDTDAGCGQNQTDHELKAEGMADTVHIPVAKKLRTENAGTGYGAENQHIKNKQQLIGDGYTGHFHSAYPADHNIIQ